MISFLIYFAWLICFLLISKAHWDDLELFGKILWTSKMVLLVCSFLFYSPLAFVSILCVWTILQLSLFYQINRGVIRLVEEENLLILFLYSAPYLLIHSVFFLFFWFLR
ncbi:MAG: hypothetical protein UU08_C0014G0005 [Candidatus Uhrbacteria bacterium GW2011_GWE2_40_58]|nr:MAG: hypothetical protein UT94_C0013G0011 [Candidatus Uhrbacteria bacterium GW2011_GWF2_40_263]KKR67548.1 MAG: hypothetical protein UU08_C0014G0005 [Candidatus Uhrbacteria bacterium GW2011_GWE2_40_58]OGL93655.1 MAG: hypothetical protein A2239_00100 [Candidatus Uhrbacteria bacterium RIFOXYA2_FULL_40_9]OGL96491.1 MAG: hypothetical protein A2332_04910 [Candidatus Uhrbacteria bacterium RIFOXYB2_FULL_41_18]HBK34590.1 hypothetical protein [Candidatus Uhrbacteria bacterium]